jgi:hypothetical protein
MALNETISRQLDEWQPAEGRSTLNVAEGGCTVAVTADRNDELGTMAWEVSVKPGAAAPGGVKAWAERCAEHVTGLPEPLKVLEIDEHRDEAVLRSTKTTKRGDARYYYEVALKGTTEASLRRYQATGTRRSQVTFPITHEALGRVVEGLATPE